MLNYRLLSSSILQVSDILVVTVLCVHLSFMLQVVCLCYVCLHTRLLSTVTKDSNSSETATNFDGRCIQRYISYSPSSPHLHTPLTSTTTHGPQFSPVPLGLIYELGLPREDYVIFTSNGTYCAYVSHFHSHLHSDHCAERVFSIVT